MNIFLAILPIFLVIGAGFGLAKLQIAKNRWNAPLNSFVYYVALPALIIQGFISLEIHTAALFGALAQSAIVILVAGLLCAALSKLIPVEPKTQATIFLTAIFGNTIFLGIPLAERLIPAIPQNAVATIAVVQFAIALIVALLFLERGLLTTQKKSHLISHLVRNPLIISLFIGVIFLFLPPIDLVEKTLDAPLRLLAQTASPLALFALGSFLAAHRLKSKIYLGVFLATAMKLVLLPLLFIVAAYLVHLDFDYASLNILLAATPTAVTAFVLTETYHLDSDLAVGVMLVTTILSIMTIPLLMGLTSGIQAASSMIR